MSVTFWMCLHCSFSLDMLLKHLFCSYLFLELHFALTSLDSFLMRWNWRMFSRGTPDVLYLLTSIQSMETHHITYRLKPLKMHLSLDVRSLASSVYSRCLLHLDLTYLLIPSVWISFQNESIHYSSVVFWLSPIFPFVGA